MLSAPPGNPLRALAAGMMLLVPGVPGGNGAQGGSGGELPRLRLTSASFTDQGALPPVLTCDGLNLSPALAWSDPPATTKSLALIVTDPDAPTGTFTHWVIFNLPASSRWLPQGVIPQAIPIDGSHQGRNDFGNPGYGGPCPPGHSVHHYHFVLYAVDRKLPLGPGASRSDVEAGLEGHVVARGELVGTYHR